jgi:Pectate lyase superfamily protein
MMMAYYPVGHLRREIFAKINPPVRFGSTSAKAYLSALAGAILFCAMVPATSQEIDLDKPYTSGFDKDGLELLKPGSAAEQVCNYSRELLPSQSGNKDPLAPKIFNSSVQARGGDIVFFQGANLTPWSRVEVNLPGGATSELQIINRVAPSWIAARVPKGVSAAFYARVINEYGSSSTIRINAPLPYHLDTTQISPGAHFRIFGQNLLRAACKPTVFVGGYPAEIDTASSHDYVLAVRAPLGISPSDAADVLVDNGGGLGPAALDGGVRVVAGSGDPLNLNVGWAASFDFATRVISSSALCNGTSDDAGAIKRALSAASALGGAIVQLPKGTCRIAGTIDFESNAVLRGAGRNDTILRYESNYPISADSKDRIGLENLQLVNAGTAQEGMVWRGNTRSFIRGVTMNMALSRQWFLTDNRDFLFDDNVVIQKGSYDQQNPYRFDRCAGLLFLNNQTTNVDGSPTFQSVRDTAFLGNHFTRDATSQGEGTVIVHHGFALDFAQRVSIIGNTFDVVNGPITNKQRNDGETILVEGGGPNRTENLGSVKTVGANFLSDPENPIIIEPSGSGRLPNLGVAIVSGTGSGQVRHVVGYEHDALKVDPAWDVLPEPGSHYSTFVWGLDKVLIIGNTLIDNPRGIWLYHTSIRDVVIRKNEIREGGGIYLRAYQNVAQKIFTVQLNTNIEENRIVNKTGNWMSHIILVSVRADNSAFGVSQFGIEVRRNMIVANQPNITSAQEDYAAYEGYASVVRVEAAPKPSFLPQLIGPIFQQNSCINCMQPFAVSVGVAGAVLSGNTSLPQTGQSIVKDLNSSGRPLGGSMGTIVLQ